MGLQHVLRVRSPLSHGFSLLKTDPGLLLCVFWVEFRLRFRKLVVYTIGEDPIRIMMDRIEFRIRECTCAALCQNKGGRSRVLGRCDIVSAVRTPLRFFRGKNRFCCRFAVQKGILP